MTQTGEAEAILKDLLQAKHNMVHPNGEFSRACVIQCQIHRTGCVHESKGFVSECGGDAKLSVWSMQDHMMGTGGSPKINTLSVGLAVAGLTACGRS